MKSGLRRADGWRGETVACRSGISGMFSAQFSMFNRISASKTGDASPGKGPRCNPRAHLSVFSDDGYPHPCYSAAHCEGA